VIGVGKVIRAAPPASARRAWMATSTRLPALPGKSGYGKSGTTVTAVSTSLCL
jgi:hypothetical protein